MTETTPIFYLTELRSQISQGDIFKNVPVAYLRQDSQDSEIAPQLRFLTGIMLTHDCEYDKTNAEAVIFAEIKSLSDVPVNLQGNVRHNKPLHTFYIPATGDLPESYIDLRHLYRVNKKFLTERNNAVRFRSVEEDIRLALQRVVTTYFGYERDFSVSETTSNIAGASEASQIPS